MDTEHTLKSPRLFKQISRDAGGNLLAVAEDGTAWALLVDSSTWQEILPLPPIEHTVTAITM